MSLVFDLPFALPRTGIDAKSFMDAMARLPAPVAVITSIGADGLPVGATISAVSSLSLDPPLFLACFDHRSATLSALRRNRHYLVHVLAAGQDGIARSFASKAIDKFSGVQWQLTAEGLPQISGCSVVLVCRLFNILPGGDHAIVAGEVERVASTTDAAPMIYVDRRMTKPEKQEA